MSNLASVRLAQGDLAPARAVRERAYQACRDGRRSGRVLGRSSAIVHAIEVTLADVQVRYEVEQEHLSQLMDLFAAEWWTADRNPLDVAQMVRASDLVFALIHEPTSRLAGFARVLTDGIYVAMVLDVIVAAEFRGLGLGSVLMNTILGHPRLAAVRSVELVCQPELVPFYGTFGFTDGVGRSRLMRRTADSLLTGG